MSTEARIAASRANGAKSHGPITEEGKLASAANSALSTGPVTPEGKARSARNSTRHEALAYSVAMENEDREAFLQLLEETCQDLKPETSTECQLVYVAAASHWRRMRLWCLESAQLTTATRRRERNADALAIAENAEIPSMFTAQAYKDLVDESRSLESLSRHEGRFSREYKSAIAIIEARRARAAAESRASSTGTKVPAAKTK